MITNAIKKKKITNDKLYHNGSTTIEELIEYFYYSGIGEFSYCEDITWYVRAEVRPTDKKWCPAIGTTINVDETWSFYDSYEELIEKHVFPNGKTMLEMLFE